MFGIGFIVGPVMGGLLGSLDLRLPFFVAGGLALLNLLYGWYVLPESLPPEKRRNFEWKAANPITSLRALAGLKGVGMLTAVLACSGLAQFILYTCWVLYTTFKFGWGPVENGMSLAAVGVMSVIVQGGLLGPLLKRFSPQKLAMAGLVSSSIGFSLWGAATQGWMMYAVIVANVLGYTVTASMQSIISNAADASNQGQTLGAVSSLNSLMAVLARPWARRCSAWCRTCRKATGASAHRSTSAPHCKLPRSARLEPFSRCPPRPPGRADRGQCCHLRVFVHDMHDKVLILDFGSQVTQLIARRVREAQCYCEVHPSDVTNDGFDRATGRPRASSCPAATPASTKRRRLGARRRCSNSACRCWASATACRRWRSSSGGKVESGHKREFGYAAVRARGHTQLLRDIEDFRRTKATACSRSG